MSHQKTVDEIIKDWEYYTLAGDASYHQQDLKLASRHFSHTVQMLEPWLEKNDKQVLPLIRLFVLSCHNSAHVLSQLSKLKEAEYYYSHAHFRLLSLITMKHHSKKLVEFTLQELESTFRQLKRFLNGHRKEQLALNIQEESDRVLRQFNQEFPVGG